MKTQIKQQDGFIQTIQNAVLTDLFDITNVNENQQGSSLENENESDNGSDENETNKVPSKREKTEKKKKKWSSSKPKSKLKKRSSCDIVKGSPGPRFEA